MHKTTQLTAWLILFAIVLPLVGWQIGSAQRPDQSGWSITPAISSGQYIAFATNAALVSQDNNNIADIYVLDSHSTLSERVSVASDGKQSNGASYQPAISVNGQFVAFASLGDNLSAPYQQKDTNHLADVFLFDRKAKTVRRVSTTAKGSAPQGWSDQPSISADGRYVAFVSTAPDILRVDQDSQADIFVYDTVDGDTLLASPGANGDARLPAISADTRFISYLVRDADIETIWIYDRVTESARALDQAGSSGHMPIFAPAISADGRFISWVVGGPSAPDIYLYDRLQDRAQLLPDPLFNLKDRSQLPQPSLSADGRYLALALESSAYVYDRQANRWEKHSAESGIGWSSLSLDGSTLAITPPASQTGLPAALKRSDNSHADPFISGWVVGGPGTPLVGIPLVFGEGAVVKTAADGSFAVAELPAGEIEIRPVLKGFKFSPISRNVEVHPGGAYALTFSAFPEGVLEAARADLGMPYGLNRGCASNDKPCGGPFSGFYSGDCTDLVMDAYLNGMDYDIQLALQSDALANPAHYYRWRDARNAHDMWRYFAYTGQILPPEQPYQVGDIVFFDWERDGIVDHVALISDTGRRGSPLKILDASGMIPENPAGLAAELDWLSYHSKSTPGHVRWIGEEQLNSAITPPGASLNIALDSPEANLRVLDSQQRMLSATKDNIPGGTYISTGLGEVLNLPLSQVTENAYTLEISAPVSVTVQLGIQIIYSGVVLDLESFSQQVTPSVPFELPLTITAQDSTYKIVLP